MNPPPSFIPKPFEQYLFALLQVMPSTPRAFPKRFLKMPSTQHTLPFSTFKIFRSRRPRLCLVILLIVLFSLQSEILFNYKIAQTNVSKLASKLKSSQITVCKPMTLSEKFSFNGTHCTQSDTEGYFLIKRSDCVIDPPTFLISDDPKWAQFVKDKIGPDEFLAIIRGPELLRLPSRYMGNCSYKFPYQLKLGGKYDLSLGFIYSNYYAIQETQDWNPLAIDAQLAVNVSWIQKGTPFVAHDWTQNEPCSTVKPAPGTWIHINNSEITQIYSNDIKTEISSLQGIKCDRDYFYHRFCSLEKLNTTFPKPRSHPQCNFRRNSKILFIGDSQSRHSYVAVLNHLLWPERREFQKFNNETTYVKSKNISVEYRYDVNLEWFLSQPQEIINSYDFISCNSAHWPASEKEDGGHWTFKQYQYLVLQVRDRILHWNKNTIPGRKTRIIWQSLNPLPLQWIYEHRGKKDWRTHTRLLEWNRFANKKLSDAGIPVTNHFHVLESIACRSYDSSHFKGDEIEATIDESLYKLGICQ